MPERTGQSHPRDIFQRKPFGSHAGSDQLHKFWLKPTEGSCSAKSNIPAAVPSLPDGRPVLPKIYFAGKIRKNCWRHTIVDGLRNNSWADGFLPQDKFVCVGPFFVSCDHGCYHKEGSHGGGTGCSEERYIGRADVAHLCIRALEQADLIFCYVDSLDCYGTQFEIGWAAKAGIPIVIVFAPGLASPQKNPFWFPGTFVAEVHFDVSEAKLAGMFDWVIGRRQW